MWAKKSNYGVDAEMQCWDISRWWCIAISKVIQNIRIGEEEHGIEMILLKE